MFLRQILTRFDSLSKLYTNKGNFMLFFSFNLTPICVCIYCTSQKFAHTFSLKGMRKCVHQDHCMRTCLVCYHPLGCSGLYCDEMLPRCWFWCLLTVRVGAEAVGALSVSRGYPSRQRLPQLQGEGVLPLRQLKSGYQFWSWEPPPLLVPMTAAWQKAAPCGVWCLYTPAILPHPWYRVLYYLQWFCR